MILQFDTTSLPGNGMVSDGRSRFTFAELRAALPRWADWLERQGCARNDCIVLPVRTDACSAAALLALLLQGQSLLLWRQSLMEHGGRIVGSDVPGFCRYALIAAPGAGSAPAITDPCAFRLVPFEEGRAPSPVANASWVYLATSGTTGKPKIVAYTHEALLGNAGNCRGRLGITADDRVIVPVPLAHMYGLGAALLPAVQAGASIRLVPDANFVNYLEAEAEFAPTAAFLTPSFCHQLLKARKQARPYRLTVLAGDRVSERTFDDNERRHGCTVALYGSTELGVIAAGNPEDPPAARRDAVGQPLPGVRLAAPPAAADPGAPHPLRFEHSYGCAGYADEDGIPAVPPSLCVGGWYNTQDLGCLDEAGRIRLSGRFDHTVKRDGVLVAFADVEQALLRLDAIDRVVVVPGCPTPRGKELVAVCTVVAGSAKDPIAIGRAARGQLPGHAVPDRFIFLDELPLTATAKPDRIALTAMASMHREDAADARPA